MRNNNLNASANSFNKIGLMTAHTNKNSTHASLKSDLSK